MKKIIKIALLFGLMLLVNPRTVFANHSWNNYHWARTSNPFTLKLGDNLTSSWDKYLSTASADWSRSIILDTQIVVGNSNPKNCKPTSGRVETCNSKYGNNGWLGIAQVWISGEHITQGITKMNDTYFNTSKYNNESWKQLVVCQEVAHTFGLDHQDETFDNPNLGSCMDYTNSPIGNEHPNLHDYQMLESIYSHLDSYTTLSLLLNQNMHQSNNMQDWGQKVNDNGKSTVFEKDFGLGNKIITHVTWAD